MRLQLLDPKGGLTTDAVLEAVFLATSAGPAVSRTALAYLTPVELALVYDWATRERLAGGGGVAGRERRTRPSCLDLAAVMSSFIEIAASESSDSVIVSRFRAYIAELSRPGNVGRAEEPRAPDPAPDLAPGPAPGPTLGPTSASPPISPGAPDETDAGELVRHRVVVDFVLELPPGAPPPTPTREAVDAAALAVAGPPYGVAAGARVSCVEASDLWDGLDVIARTYGEARRRSIHRALVDAAVRTPGHLRRHDAAALRRIPGLGPMTIRTLIRHGLVGQDDVLKLELWASLAPLGKVERSRVVNALANAKILTPAQLWAASADTLARVKNLGVASRAKLAVLGLLGDSARQAAEASGPYRKLCEDERLWTGRAKKTAAKKKRRRA